MLMAFVNPESPIQVNIHTFLDKTIFFLLLQKQVPNIHSAFVSSNYRNFSKNPINKQFMKQSNGDKF